MYVVYFSIQSFGGGFGEYCQLVGLSVSIIQTSDLVICELDYLE